MAGEEADREITLRWADRAALASPRTALMRRLGGSAQEGGDDPSFFSSKTRAQWCSLQAAVAQQKAYARLPKHHLFFLRSHPAVAAAAPWWGCAQITPACCSLGCPALPAILHPGGILPAPGHLQLPATGISPFLWK